VFVCFRQRRTGIVDQLRLLVRGIGRHARGGAAQVDARLQQVIPGGGDFTLLNTKFVRNRKTVLVGFNRREKQTAGNEL